MARRVLPPRYRLARALTAIQRFLQINLAGKRTNHAWREFTILKTGRHDPRPIRIDRDNFGALAAISDTARDERVANPVICQATQMRDHGQLSVLIAPDLQVFGQMWFFNQRYVFDAVAVKISHSSRGKPTVRLALNKFR